MDTGKVYQDSEGNDCSIVQMIERKPHWAANRLQEGEKAIERCDTLWDENKELVELNKNHLKYIKSMEKMVDYSEDTLS